MTPVAASQRFTRAHPCPVCGGGSDDPRGAGVRCWGFRTDDGRWAHCTRPEVSVGLEWDHRSGTYAHRLRGVPCRCGVTHPGGDLDEGRRPVAIYPYRDEAGTVLYEVVRFEPKGFRQRRPDGHEGWIWNLDGTRRVLYRLPELRGHKTVYVTEGEKDADRLRALGLPATCNPGGAGKWGEEYTEQLQVAGVERVIVLGDNDRPGEVHAVQVARSSLAVGLTVQRPRLPGLPPFREKHGEDVSDWLDAGHTVEELRAVVEAAPGLTVADLESPATAPPGLHLVPLADLLAEPEEEVRWLVDQRLPAGGLSLLAGKPKAGKSTLARCLALAVARDEAWLGFKTTSGLVFYLALEEKRSEVRAHFKAMGAAPDDPIRAFIAPSPHDGLAQLRQAVEQERPALIIVDPLIKLVRVRDANDYAAVTQALEPLLTLARETGAHVLAVHHLGKGERSGGDAILGSTAIFAAVDTALLLKRSERYRTLSSIQRYGEDLEEITLALDPVTRIISAGPSRREADETQVAEAILEYLTAQIEPVAEETIMAAVEGKHAVKRRALRWLVEQGKAARSGQGKRGDPYRYAVAGSPPPDPSPDSDSIFSYPNISGYEGTRNENEGVTPRQTDTYSRTRETATCGANPESRVRESEPMEEVDL